ncbi:hypothetical protein DWV76_00825 [Segatella copri]|uniref:Uncharacterized protein n=1 Tax=Segatella copri TaxID=165179 RepID=A0AA92U097_9BACT|nr:hypothetical protein [Segatella copri]RGW45095.1 hypothetical protein DWV76_00825 [Segatella copri]
MEENINIAEILKNKPKGTKLYADAFGELSIEDIYAEDKDELGITLSSKDGDELLFYNDGKYNIYGEPILVPSKEMRDWEKFAWKRGDVLVNSRGLKILFDRWANDNYTSFYAKTINLVEDGFLDTNLHTLVSEKEAKSFIKCIEEKLGGKLNRETLEIEKTQPEFKDGDIVFMKGIKDGYFANCIFILRSEYKDGDERAFYYAFYNADDKFTTAEYGYTRVHYSLRPATDSEKQQLFDALAKKGKTWNAEKKQIVDLKPKFDELKPFDNVLVRHQKTEEWRANIFSHTDKTDEYLDYVCVNGRWEFCIPYEGNESLLGTTKDVEG